jgi:glycosyltransferase involved in cell wall biosynthesis
MSVRNLMQRLRVLCTTFERADAIRSDAWRRMRLAASELRSLGHEVIVVAPDEHGERGSRRIDPFWRVTLDSIAFDSSPGLATAITLRKSLRALAKVIRSTGPDLVLAHDLMAAHGAIKAMRDVDCGEVVIDFAGAVLASDTEYDQPWTPIWLRYFEQCELDAMRSPARALVTSDALRSLLMENGHAGESIRVIGDAVDTVVFAPDQFRRMRPQLARADEFVIALHGLHRIEHWQPVIAAAKRIVPHVPNVRFWVVGSPLADDLRRLIVQSSMSQRFNFGRWDHVESISAYLGSADIALVAPAAGVHGSRKCPSQVLEAAACGLPVVAPDSEGCSALNALPGIRLYQATSEVSLAQALLDYASRAVQLSLMGAENRAAILQHYSSEKLARAFGREVTNLAVQPPVAVAEHRRAVLR